MLTACDCDHPCKDYTDSYMLPDNNTEANAAVIVDEAEKLQ